MKYKYLESIGTKLLVLVFTVLATLIIFALLFSSSIEKLKKQVDTIYFASYIPNVKLNLIKDNLQNIVLCLENPSCNIEKEKKIIENEWNYYIESFKRSEEKEISNILNEEFLNLFINLEQKKFIDFKEKIINLINFKQNQAFEQRKGFLEDYKQMQDFLFYNTLLILFLAFLVIIYIVLKIIKKENQLKVLNKQYKIDSITDSLTTLYNRKYFDEIFDNMPFISNANLWKCAFIIADIDYFKEYNDTYGHDKGDDALKIVALTIKNYFSKENQYVFRLGGEEFGVVLFNIDEKYLENSLENLRNEVVKLQIEHKNSKILPTVSISLGASMYIPNSYTSANSLYKRADDALYRAKNSGRNRYYIDKKEE